MADPYITKQPNDLIRAADWNQIQIRTRDDIEQHGHTGGEDGVQIGTDSIADGAVTPAKLDPAVLDGVPVGPGSVGAIELADGAVVSQKIANRAVTSEKLAENLSLSGGLQVSGYPIRPSFDHVHLDWGASVYGGYTEIPDVQGQSGFQADAANFQNVIRSMSGGAPQPRFLTALRILSDHLEPEIMAYTGAQFAFELLDDAALRFALARAGLDGDLDALEAAFHLLDLAYQRPWTSLLLALARTGTTDALELAYNSPSAGYLVQNLRPYLGVVDTAEVMASFAVPIGGPLLTLRLPPVTDVPHVVMEVELQGVVRTTQTTTTILMAIGSDYAPPPPGAFALVTGSSVADTRAAASLRRRVRYLSEVSGDRTARLWGCVFRSSTPLEHLTITARTLAGPDPVADQRLLQLASSKPALRSLELLGGAPLQPGFSPDVTEYACTLSPFDDRVSVVPVLDDRRLTVTVNGIPVAPGRPSSPSALGPEDERLAISVTAPSGDRQTYQVAVHRRLEERYLKAREIAAGHQLGSSISLWGDTLAVGAFGDGSGDPATPLDSSAADSGAVYIFRRASDGRWNQEAYVKARAITAGERFGVSVSLWGDVLAVGAASGGGGTLPAGTGAVYLFQRDAEGWRQLDRLLASDARPGDRFGGSVSLWGNTLAVGASGVDGDDADLPDSGAVYMFQRQGERWSEQARLAASNRGATDGFGACVSLSGNWLAVGAHGEDSGNVDDPDDNSAASSGAVYVFQRDGDSWSEQAYLEASNLGTGDLFGRSVSLSGDTLAVGATGEGSGDPRDPANELAASSGAVYVFQREGTEWRQQAYLKASNLGEGDQFGHSVSLRGDVLAVGAIREASGDRNKPDDNSVASSGAVYVFQRRGTEWSQRAYLKASNPGANDRFGVSTSLYGGTLAIGALGEDSSDVRNPADDEASQSGAVYVMQRRYDTTGETPTPLDPDSIVREPTPIIVREPDLDPTS